MVVRPVIPIAIAAIILGVILAVYIWITLGKKGSWKEKLLGILRVLLVLSLVFLVNLRIMEKRYDVNVETKNIDVLFVVDTTISMWAEDYQRDRTRMTGVKETAKHIMEELHGSSFALIRFDNKSQILAPFTQDSKSVSDAFDTIKAPDIWYATGSSMNTPYEDMKTLLESSSEKEGKTTVLFFMSDGEITDDSDLISFAELESLVDTGAVLGFGTSQGGKMRDGYGSFVYDYENYQDALSIIDEDNLRTIAKDFDVEYIRVEGENRVDSLVNAVKTTGGNSMGKSDAVLYDDTYYYYAVPLLLLLGLEAFMLIRKGRV